MLLAAEQVGVDNVAHSIATSDFTWILVAFGLIALLAAESIASAVMLELVARGSVARPGLP